MLFEWNYQNYELSAISLHSEVGRHNHILNSFKTIIKINHNLNATVDFWRFLKQKK